MERESTVTPRRRRDAGILQITERDMICFTWIGEQFCISFDHLRRLLGRHAKAPTKTPDMLSISATRDTLERWLQLDLIESPRKIIAEHPPFVWLSRRGLTQLGLSYSYYEPRPATIRHFYAVNAIRLALESFALQCSWVSYRTLRRYAEPTPLPDAELHARAFPLIAVQVIERPTLQDITLHDELETLVSLATRAQGNAQRYTRLWYFLHTAIVPIIREALVTFDPQIQKRVTLFGLDAQELDP